MHGHEHDTEAAESLRPKASRLDDPTRALAARAAAEGRWTAVSAGGVHRGRLGAARACA